MKWTFVVLIDLHYRHDIPCKQFYYIFEFVKVQSKVLSVPFPQTQCLCGHNIMHISLPYDVYIYFAGTTAGTQPKCGNGGVSDAVTSELGDRHSSHPVKTLLQYYGKSLEALPGVACPGFRDNHRTLNTKTGFKKMSYLWVACLSLPPAMLQHACYARKCRQ